MVKLVLLMFFSILGTLELRTATAFGQTSDARTLSEILRLSVECPMPPEANRQTYIVPIHFIYKSKFLGDENTLSVRIDEESRREMLGQIKVNRQARIVSFPFAGLIPRRVYLRPPSSTIPYGPYWKLEITCRETKDVDSPSCGTVTLIDIDTGRHGKNDTATESIIFCDEDRASRAKEAIDELIRIAN